MKRIICLLLSLAFCWILLPAVPARAESELRFDDSGEFRILLLSDTQDTSHPQKAMLALMEAVLEEAQPDLVIFLGDQLHGPVVGRSEERTQEAIRQIVTPVVDRGIPFAVVFGNHDDEGDVSKEKQLAWYQSYAGCLMEEGEDLTGCGNYMLPVYGKEGEPLVKLWFFDSNTYPPKGMGTYDWVQEDQIEWYLQADSQLPGIPGYAFQHIIVPEIYDALEQVEKGTPGAVQGACSYEKGYYRLPEGAKGMLNEGPCPPDHQAGEFDAWIRSGDLVAAFFGHDHVNDFELNYKGIDLVNTTGLGFFIYGDGGRHGARLITLREDTPGQYETKMLFYQDLMEEPLPPGLSPTLGAFIQSLILLAVLAVLILIILTVILICRKRKKKQRKAAETMGV